VLLLAIAVAVAVLLRAFVAQAYYIPSASMEPTLDINDRVVVSRISYDLHSVHRGDIVVFRAPRGVLPEPREPHNLFLRWVRGVGATLGIVEDHTVLIKRVIGLPGDTVEAREGRVYVDGKLLLEPYLRPGTLTSSFGPIMVPPGHVWVMGDNRGDSEDSRVFGPIPIKSIIGRAIWRVWPPQRLGFL
jgi:signal peptidase I